MALILLGNKDNSSFHIPLFDIIPFIIRDRPYLQSKLDASPSTNGDAKGTERQRQEGAEAAGQRST